MIRAGRLLLATLALAGSTAPLRADQPKPEPVLVELALGRLVTRTVSAYKLGPGAMIPLTQFLEMSEMAVIRRLDGSVETIVQPGNIPLRIDVVAKTMKLGNERRALADTEMVAAEREVYLSTGLLTRIFNLEWAVSWEDLEVAVLEPGNLPIARRLRRESYLRTRLNQSENPAYSAIHLGLQRQGVKGLIFDYSVLTPTTSVVDGGAYSTTLGLDIFGGSFAAGLQSQNGAGKAPRADVSWTGIWRESPYLTQLQVGDGIGSGPRSRTMRGFSITNSPFLRPATLGNVPFGGQLGPGWTVEAYRGGRLVGFDSVNALGQFSFDVPVQYGENPVDFVAYGPFGEVREFNRTYRVRTEGLPANKLEYGLSAGQCRTTRCSATGNFDLRYGISNRWTARAGVDQFWRDSLGNLSHPYVGLIGNIGNAVSLEGEAVGDAVLRGVARFEPTINLQLTAEANRFARGLKDPILTPAGRLDQLTLSAFFRPISRLGGTYLEGSIDRIHGASSDLTSGRIGASLQLSDLRLIPAVRFEKTEGVGASFTRTYYGFNAFLLPRASLPGVLGTISARSSFELQQGEGVSSASGFVGIPVMKGLRTETGLTWFKGMRGATFSFMLAAELPSVRSFSTVSAGGGVPAVGTQYVQGSAIYNPTGGVDFLAGPSLQRGGVTGRVFLDVNGNGKFDSNEQPLSGVRVVVGPTFAMSDSAGEYRVWDLLPFEPTSLMIDSTTLASPLWVPSFAAGSVEPQPNRYRKFDIPILPGGAVEGRVVWAAAGERANSGQAGSDSVVVDSSSATSTRPSAGIALVFRHAASGEQRIVTTFTDGGFYVMGLRPGEWEITVDKRCLGLLKASSRVAKFTIKSDVEGDAVEGLEVVLSN